MATTKHRSSRATNAAPLALGLFAALALGRPDARACSPPRTDATLAIRTVLIDDVPERYVDAYGDSGARSRDEVLLLEDLFYCCHNAVRSAQLGSKTVPKGFHPVVNGGVIHERRHALTWCLSPKTRWQDVDLST